MAEMIDGQHVTVRLGGDDTWYHGIVIRARKREVDLHDYGHAFVADETNIVEWRPVDPSVENQLSDQGDWTS